MSYTIEGGLLVDDERHLCCGFCGDALPAREMDRNVRVTCKCGRSWSDIDTMHVHLPDLTQYEGEA